MFLPVLVLGALVLSSVYNISKSIINTQKQQLMSQIASLEGSLDYLSKIKLEEKADSSLRSTVRNLKSFSQEQISINGFALSQLNKIVIESIFIFGVGLFLLGIIYSHRIAGPIFRLQRILQEAAKNILVPIKVRPTDEFQEFFAALENMRRQFLDNKIQRGVMIDNAIQKLENIKKNAPAEISAAIEALKEDIIDLKKV